MPHNDAEDEDAVAVYHGANDNSDCIVYAVNDR